ncbi:hypothetical protein ACTHGU_00330 [Chitinophagaceae bacterium MMS25-I14]
MTLTEVKAAALGTWASIAPEVRPSAFKNPDGSLKPFYLARTFTSLPDDGFVLEIINFADPYGKVPLVKMIIRGHIAWRGEHPIAEGAQKVDFTADEAYEVMPLHESFAGILNSLAAQGYDHWEVNQSQDILKKEFKPFGLAEGQVFKEFDLVFIHGGMMFWGARNVDGRGFDTEENRPANLQIPLVKQF